MAAHFSQAEYDVRCEWGLEGIAAISPGSDAVVVVDVLSFSTCVDVAVGRGAIIYPYRWRDVSAVAYAESVGAVLANPNRDTGAEYSLSPASLLGIAAGTRLALPSPNGATLSLATGDVPTFAGCLRNAGAVAEATRRLGKRVAVIPAGERWEGGGMRPAIEDLLGAGAIIHRLKGTRSPEAAGAEALFLYFRQGVAALLNECSSGKELRERGFSRDVELAAALDVSSCAPRLVGGAYVGEGV